MRNLVRVRLTLLAVVMLALATHCTTVSFEQGAYQTLTIAGTSYDAGMKTVADLQKQGRITADQRQVINQYANYVYTAYQTATDAFIAYKQTGSADAKNKLTQALAIIGQAWSTFALNVNRVVPGSMPIDLNQVQK